jgi:hypothetical protein
MNFKLRSKSKISHLPNKNNNRHSSVSTPHHYLQKQSSKIFNPSPRLELDIVSKPRLQNVSHAPQKELPFNNLGNILKEATQTHSFNQSTNNIITVNGLTGEWINKEECLKWRGPIPLEQYKINQDPNPTIVHKRRSMSVPVQEIGIRYLKPTRLPDAGDLILKEDEPIHLPHAPPIILRQNTNAALKPRIIREKPPMPPKHVPIQTITIPGKVLDPPKRQVIIERVDASVNPQEIILERWLSYPKQKPNIVFQPCQKEEQMPLYKTPQNIIIDWDFSEISKTKLDSNIEYSIQTADPNDYNQKYLNEFIDSNLIDNLISKYEVPTNEIFASDLNENEDRYILTGAVEALKLVDKSNDDINKYLHVKF